MIHRYRAAGGVVIDGDRVLLLDRPMRDEIRLPKGHVEAGEDDREAALREVAEESGQSELEILADLGEQQVAYGHAGQSVLRSERYYLMRLAGPTQVERPPADRAQFEPRWTALTEAERELSYASERNALRKARAWLASQSR